MIAVSFLSFPSKALGEATTTAFTFLPIMSNYCPVRSEGARFSLDGPSCYDFAVIVSGRDNSVSSFKQKTWSKSVMSEILFLGLNTLHLKNQQTPQIFRERSFKDLKNCISQRFLFTLFLPQAIEMCSCRTFRCCWAKLFLRNFIYYRGCACVCVWGVCACVYWGKERGRSGTFGNRA